jgi:hypothetical protein
VTDKDDGGPPLSPEQRREQIAAAVPHTARNAGDRLRAVDLASAVRDGNTDKVVAIVSEALAAGDHPISNSAARMMHLLLAYTGVSVPVTEAMLARHRQEIVNEEFGDLSEEFGAGSE